MTPKTVTILGMASTSQHGADLDAKRGELWGLNTLYRALPDARFTRWFEIHTPDYLRREVDHWEWLGRQGAPFPIYMQEHYSDIPLSLPFPREELNEFMRERFDTEADYYTSTFSYMVGLALMEGFEEIRIFGVDLDEDCELVYERSGLEFLIGIARGAGVKVIISPRSPLLHIGYVYGYVEPRLKLEQVAPLIEYLTARIEESKAHSKDNAAAIDAYIAKHAVDGAITGAPGDVAREALDTQLMLTGSIRGMRNARHWLRLYGRGGTLLLPDGSVNE